MKNLPHPIQYQGSKRNLAPVILRYVPKGIERLIEPFAGSAAISIATAARQMEKSYISTTKCVDKLINRNTALFKQARQSTDFDLLMIRRNTTLSASTEHNMTASLTHDNKA